MMTTEQLMAAHKANLDTFFMLGQKSFEGIEKLMLLNLQVAKTALDEAADTTKSLASAKDMQELMSMSTQLVQPSVEKMAAYGRHVHEIATSTGSFMSKLAETQLAEGQKKIMSVVDNAAKNAPAGTENTVVFLKSAMAAASNALDTMQKAAKQATDVAEANFQAVTNTAVKASQTATKARRAS